ncbi:MAG TPA: NAD-dependent epimerase/dehydratase family protein [Methylophilaceae bacterium]|nr:NAD-dependent epimerase/dehydratase family protein [Methylophilaceae bacterium]
MQTLVTGATGFIGRRLLQPMDRALVRRKSNLTNEVIGDLLDPRTLKAACKDIDTVFHCAGYSQASQSSDPDIHWGVNYEGTKNLLDAAIEERVSQFIYLSSVKAMAEPGDQCVQEGWPGEPATEYGKAKRSAERLVLEAGKKHGMRVTVLRLAMVYGRGGRGNMEKMGRWVEKGLFPPLPETGNKRSIVHVEDVIDAVHLVASKPEANGRTYIIADARAYSGREIYDAIREQLGKKVCTWSVPSFALKLGGVAGDFIETLAHSSLPLNSEVIDRLLRSSCYSPALIEEELGWRANIGLDAGLQEMLGINSTLSKLDHES